MSQIDLIRAEIERRLSYYHPENVNHGLASGFREDGKAIAYKELLSFLDTIKEQPVCEGLEEEIDRFEDWMETYNQADYPTSFTTRDIARHFYELGRQSKPKVSEELETEALRSAGVLLSEHFEDEDDDAIRTTALRCWKGGVIHGASWQKDQLMKEAIVCEAEVCKLADRVWVTPTDAKKLQQDTYNNFKAGDKVRIIIVKED